MAADDRADSAPAGGMLAQKLGRARQELDLREGRPIFDATDEAQRWLDAAAFAGIAVAAVGLSATSDAGGSITPADATPPAARTTATVRGTDSHPLARDDYATYLREQIDRGRNARCRTLLTEDEAIAAAALLDELHGVYAGEDLGRLARELAVTINDRLGI